MDNDKLDTLRKRYAEASMFDIHDPQLRAVALTTQTGDGRRRAPFSGISTFLDAPTQPSLEGLDVALIGVPMDLGVSNRAGARLGPRAIRAIERIGPYNHQSGIAPVANLNFADVGDCPVSRYSLENSLADIEHYFDTVVAAGVRPLSAGGDHSITYPILKSLGRDRPVGLLHIDAHCDTGGIYDDEKFHHGGPFRHAVLDGVLDPERTVQIGIRGSSELAWEFSYESGMTVVHIEDFMRKGIAETVDKARAVLGDGPVYVSIDVDGFDPAYAPGTGTPEVGGLTPREGQQLLRGLSDLNVIGGDVVEVAPQYDPTTNTAQLGAQLMFEILCMMSSTNTHKA
ncbi:MAG: guanidinopropionase [Gammaproteobacteria bacterium]|jgi:guanidinopropionase